MSRPTSSRLHPTRHVIPEHRLTPMPPGAECDAIDPIPQLEAIEAIEGVLP